jgi:tight adherence protein C
VSAAVSGALLGGAAGAGALLAGSQLARMRRPDFDLRVLAYLRDLPSLAADRPVLPATSQLQLLLGPLRHGLAARLERLLGGSASIRRRIERAGLDLTVAEFRTQQATWGLVAFAAASALSVLVALRSPTRAVPLLVLCCLAFLVGALLRENRLSAQVATHERRVLAELPAVAELLALSVAAGEGPVAALGRVVERTSGDLAADLSQVLAEVRGGTPVAVAFDGYAARTGLPVVARFADGVSVAVERGTPLADVLHAQAADVREARRRDLIENGARREVLMMVPVVFLVLPVTVLFAFWPGLVGLRLATS